jgi:hypothetical protein
MIKDEHFSAEILGVHVVKYSIDVEKHSLDTCMNARDLTCMLRVPLGSSASPHRLFYGSIIQKVVCLPAKYVTDNASCTLQQLGMVRNPGLPVKDMKALFCHRRSMI